MINTQEYVVDHKSLDKPRPLGVSGMLRCKDCADFLEACIESCIDALDELVVVFNHCKDKTEEILYQMQEIYPDKIKIYPYMPFVYPINLTVEQYAEVMSLPSDSIHLLTGYNNYAISKTTYRYVIKIDADQIYFKEKFVRLCNAYRATNKVKITLCECIAYNMYQAYCSSFRRKEMQNYLWMEGIAVALYPYYYSYVEKMIINEKTVVSLSGINLYTNGEDWMVGTGKKGTDVLPPFNGTRDHFFFQVTSLMMMERAVFESKKNNYQVLEILYCNHSMIDAGFCWFHVRANMNNNIKHSDELYQKFPESYVPIKKFCKSRYRNLPIYDVPRAAFSKSIFSYFFMATKKKLPWKKLDELRNTYVAYQNERLKLQKSKGDAEGFKKGLQRIIQSYLKQCKTTDSSYLQIENYDVEDALSAYLLLNMECTQTLEEASSYLDHFIWEKSESFSGLPSPPYNKEWEELLSNYQNYVLVYIHDEEQLNSLLPIISQLDSSVLLLSEYELPDDTDVPEESIALTLELMEEAYLYNPNLKRNFPVLYQYVNTFDTLIQLLSPSQILCQDLILYQELLLKTIADYRHIPLLEI